MEKKEKLERGSEMITIEEFKSLFEERINNPITSIREHCDKLSDEDRIKWKMNRKNRKWNKEVFNPQEQYNIFTGIFYDHIFDSHIRNEEDFWYIGYTPLVKEFFEHYVDNPWEIAGIYSFSKDSDYYLFNFTRTKDLEYVEISYVDNSYIDLFLALYGIFTTEKNNISVDLNNFDKWLAEISKPIKVPRKGFNYKEFFTIPLRYTKEVTNIFDISSLRNERFGNLEDFVEFIDPEKQKIEIGDLYFKDIEIDGLIHELVLDIFTDEDEIKKLQKCVSLGPKGREKVYYRIPNEDDNGIIENNKLKVDSIFRCNDYYLQRFICYFFKLKINEIIIDCYKDNIDCKELQIFIPENYKDDKYEDKDLLVQNISVKLYNCFKDNEFASKEDVKDAIVKDIKELKICSDNGAYKAAIILAGSILEAVLIQWLSEYYKKDYFKEKMEKISISKEIKRDLTSLDDYIKALQYKYPCIKDPPWYSQADVIRKKRNIVHAKLFIEDMEVNQETCSKICDYLLDIIDFWQTHSRDK